MIQDITPHKYTVSYKVSSPSPGDFMLIYSQNAMLYTLCGNFPTMKELSDINPDISAKAVYLFTVDDSDYYTVVDADIIKPDTMDYIKRADMRNIRPVWHCFVAMLGLHLHTWYASNIYCGKCTAKNELSTTERALICPSCGKISYPQICPCVIVAVTDKDRILLTRYANTHSPHRRYALVAGYNEIGESLEDTVRREVMEEVGLKVKNITYYKSQPWSYTGSLLMGFFCEVDGDATVTIDESELSVAQWLESDNIPTESADPTISLTGTMIYEFKNGYRLK